jgi:hypothetical protein
LSIAGQRELNWSGRGYLHGVDVFLSPDKRWQVADPSDSILDHCALLTANDINVN